MKKDSNSAPLIKRYVLEEETDDMVYYRPFVKAYSGFFEKDLNAEYIQKGKETSWGGDCHPISIDELEKILTKMKSKGATHIEMMFHCDHDSYVFNGVEIRKPTQDEIDKYYGLVKDKKRKIIEKKRDDLKKQIGNLDEELKNLK